MEEKRGKEIERAKLPPFPWVPLRTLSSSGLDPAAALVLKVSVNVRSLLPWMAGWLDVGGLDCRFVSMNG